MGGRTDGLVSGKMCEKLTDFFLAHFTWVALVVEEDKPLHPVDVGVFRAQTVMPGADPGHGLDLAVSACVLLPGLRAESSG